VSTGCPYSLAFNLFLHKLTVQPRRLLREELKNAMKPAKSSACRGLRLSAPAFGFRCFAGPLGSVNIAFTEPPLEEARAALPGRPAYEH